MKKIFQETLRMTVFSIVKTQYPFYGTFLTTAFLTCTTFITAVFYKWRNNKKTTMPTLEDFNIMDNLKYMLLKKNVIVLDGKKYSYNNYWYEPIETSMFSDRFKAVWKEILDSVDKNDSVHEIKDYCSIVAKSTRDREKEHKEPDGDNNSNNDNIFIVSQKSSFLFHKELNIYACTRLVTEESESEGGGKNIKSKTDKIEITLYSYSSSLSVMKDYIDSITQKYVDALENQRNKNKFIYSLIKTKYQEDKTECWKESILDTTRSFDNIFFEDKPIVLAKLRFFLTNKDWYYRKGIPYTLGFGLHGVPGTGKTSFIKSLAVYTNRHIVSLSLKLIKTRSQLHNFFFEDKYNHGNKRKTIGFSDKIIVIEDIDAQGDIVRKRGLCLLENNDDTEKYELLENQNHKKYSNTNTNSRKEKEKDIHNQNYETIKSLIEEDPITLDDILNVWDGIEETSGRIMVISSNFYEELDPALIRPGRIDVSIEMKNTSHAIIAEMYRHLYETDIDVKQLKKVKEYLYSPAEIINIFIQYQMCPDSFMKRLIQNRNV